MIDETKKYNSNPVQFAANTSFSGSTIILVCILIIAVVIISTVVGGDAGANGSSGAGTDGAGFFGSWFSNDNVQSSSDEKTNNLFIVLVVAILFILLLVGGIRYLFNTSIYANFSDVFGPSPEVDIVIDHDDVRKKEDPDQEPEISPEPIVQDEVFNIPGNYYGYDMAKNLCSAYGARLAKYDEVEDAYENGAEWCNYGWSEGQMALFPTQQDTFNKLQKVEGHEHDCGRPGINGGFMANPKVKYGVNCYGKKPQLRDDERFLMENKLPINKTKKDLVKDKEIEMLKKNIDNILVSPFNYTHWSRV